MAVSPDLRRHATDAYARGEGSIKAIAARFSVGSASLSRWLSRKRSTGSVVRAPRAGGNPRRVSADGEALLTAWLRSNPSMAQHELARRLYEATGQTVAQQTVGRTLARMRITRKNNDASDAADHA